MIVRALDILGDWTFGKGKNNYLSKNDAIAQDIKTRLKSFLGDCFFDIGAGIDWWNLLGSKQRAALELSIATTILNTDGVTGIIELSTNLDNNRNLRVQYSVNTIYTGIVYSNGIIATVTGSVLITESGSTITTEIGSPLTTES